MPTTTDIQPAQPKTAIGQSRLVGPNGTTSIADMVVAKIAAVAAREVEGVVDLVPGGFGATVAGLAQRVIRADQRGTGVEVEVGQRETAVDMNLKVAYGVNIADVAERVRANVITRIQSMTGLVAKEVNINVVDVDFADEPVERIPEPRVA